MARAGLELGRILEMVDGDDWRPRPALDPKREEAGGAPEIAAELHYRARARPMLGEEQQRIAFQRMQEAVDWRGRFGHLRIVAGYGKRPRMRSSISRARPIATGLGFFAVAAVAAQISRSTAP